jgi:hypothetical protein
MFVVKNAMGTKEGMDAIRLKGYGPRWKANV